MAHYNFQYEKLVWTFPSAYLDENSRQGKYLKIHVGHTKFPSTLRTTSPTRMRAHDHYTPSTLIGGKGGAGPHSLHTTIGGPTKYVNARWIYMDSDMASNGSCFMVTRIVFKNHLLEVGLAQNRETIALQTLTITDSSYFIMCEDPP